MSERNEPLDRETVRPRERTAFMALLKMLGPAGVVMQDAPDWGRLPADSEAHFHHFHQMLARDNRTSASLLSIVARQASAAVLERIAEHPRTSSQTLRELAQHYCAEVRAAVAENPECPPDVLLLLIEDENPDVRYRLAENYSLDRDLLARLTEDDNPYVSFRAHKTLQRLTRPSCEVRTIKKSSNSRSFFDAVG